MRSNTLLVLALIVPPACGGSAPASDVDGGGDGSVPRLVTGYVGRVAHTPDGEVAIPADLSTIPVRAWIDAGDWEMREGVGSADGTFAFADEILGCVYVTIGADVVHLCDGSRIDLVTHVVGAGPSGFGDQPVPELIASVDGMLPWIGFDPPMATDLMVLWVPDFGAQYFPTWYFAAVPPPGATAFDGFSFELPGNPLFAGETAWLSQWRATEVQPARWLLTRERAGMTGAIEFPGGEYGTIEATLTETAPRLDLALDWRGRAFADLADATEPGNPHDGDVSVVNLPVGSAPWRSAGEELLFGRLSSSNTPISSSALAPIVGGWTTFVSVAVDVSLLYRPSEAGMTLVPSSMVRLVTPAAANGPLEPLISQPRDLLLDGSDASIEDLSISGTPTVTWSPPSSGTPARYEVVIDRRFRYEESPAAETVGRIYTTSTAVRVPPGILVAGEKYRFEVHAISSPASDPEGRPRDFATPYGSAAVVSGLVLSP